MTGQAPTDLDGFRRYVGDFLAAEMPLRDADDQRDMDMPHDLAGARAQKALQRRLYDAGLAGLRYPAVYGGQGLTPEHQAILNEEAEPYVMPLAFTVTLGNVGPTILDYGTEDQKRHFIPRMLSGEDLWVQFLSEPSAGSDLAAVRTSAVRDGGDYVLNGAKVWSSGAEVCDYAICLARTDWDQPKHNGLTMFIVAMDSPGVTVRPIKMANQDARFCEEFLSDVRVPSADILGELNDGWTVARRLLEHERTMSGAGSLDGGIQGARRGGADTVAELERFLADAPGRADARTTVLAGEARMLADLIPAFARHVGEEIAAGAMTASASSMLKLFATTSRYRIRQICADIGASQLAAWSGDDTEARFADDWIIARYLTIAGGTMEIQRNMIAERVLGLPRERPADTGIPFREVSASGGVRR
jgi:alkylation response protein AidB-like acyl-CoA dehydrogenase